jgi:hypothetical protein
MQQVSSTEPTEGDAEMDHLTRGFLSGGPCTADGTFPDASSFSNHCRQSAADAWGLSSCHRRI